MSMKFGFEIFLIFLLPLGTAVIFGAIAERLGAKVMSGLVAIGGLCLGTYFLSSILAIFIVR
jgi:hypothetical protein